MRSDPSSVPPQLDSRALMLVVEVARNAPGSSRESLLTLALRHPRASGVEEAALRQVVDSYADATQGFRRPPASAGYVLAGLYATRGRAARWIGIPFLI